MLHRFFLSFFAFFFLCVTPVSAHGFGQQYTLPLPAWMYVFGGGVTVFVSFLLVSFFLHSKKQTRPPFTFPVHQGVKNFFIRLGQVISVFLFFLSLIAGFIGIDISTLNINMTYFWVLIFIGGVYASSIFGNIWKVFHPVSLTISFIEWATDEKITGILPYRKNIDILPAFLALFVLLLCEFIFPTSPFSLSVLLLSYLTYLIVGSVLFGKEEWVKNADPLYVYFDFIGRLSPFSFTKKGVEISFPGKRLLSTSFSFLSLLYILLLLASTSVDGFVETAVWFSWYYGGLSLLGNLFPFAGYQLTITVFLLGVTGIFLFCYLLTCFLAARLTNTPSKKFILQFAGTLLPIVLAYHVAHYLSLFLTQGQSFFALLSDPFGYGWNLFGTASFSPNIALVDAGVFWHIQLCAIIVGHIWAVILSHLKALELFQDRKALVSQLPFLLLMIFYTIGGLWLLSQPMS